MSKRNEYDEIYLKDNNFGLEYIYKNHRLGGERIIPSEEFYKIETFKYNEDKILIRCGKCDINMDFAHGINGASTGKWFCPECGTYVKETTVNRYISELEPLVDEDEDDDYDDIY